MGELVRKTMSEYFVGVITTGCPLLVDELPGFILYDLYRLLELQHLWRTTLEAAIVEKARGMFSEEDKVARFCKIAHSRVRVDVSSELESKLLHALWHGVAEEAVLFHKAATLGRHHFDVFMELYVILWSKLIG